MSIPWLFFAAWLPVVVMARGLCSVVVPMAIRAMSKAQCGAPGAGEVMRRAGSEAERDRGAT